MKASSQLQAPIIGSVEMFFFPHRIAKIAKAGRQAYSALIRSSSYMFLLSHMVWSGLANGSRTKEGYDFANAVALPVGRFTNPNSDRSKNNRIKGGTC